MNSDRPRKVTMVELVRPVPLLEQFGIEIIFPSEASQLTGSFKFRAAWRLVQSVIENHIIAASSGNFGQALAYACMLAQKQCTIIMPETSAQVKIDAVESFGARVELIDTNTTSRHDALMIMGKQHSNAYLASPFNDPHVIDGNSTLGRELAGLIPPSVPIIAPLGGGGLLSGILLGLYPKGAQRQVFAAEPSTANDGARSFRAGKIIANDSEPQSIADGARTLSIGTLTWPILKEGLADVIEVGEEKIRQAVRILFHSANLKVEPTGALSLAAVLEQPDRFEGQRVCCVISGGNVDADIFSDIILER